MIEKIRHRMDGKTYKILQLLLFTVLVIQLVRYVIYGKLDLADEGYRFYLSWSVVQKDLILYRDVFTRYAPGYVVLPGMFMKITGFTIYWFRIYNSILTIIIVYGLYLISKRFTRSELVSTYTLSFVVLAWIPVIPNFKTGRILFVIPYFLFGRKLLTQRVDWRNIVVLGFVVTLAGIMSHEVGAFLTFSSIVLIYLSCAEITGRAYFVFGKRAAIFIASGALFTLPALAYYSYHNAVGFLIHDLVFSTLEYSETMGLPVWYLPQKTLSGFEVTVIGVLRTMLNLSGVILLALPVLLIAIGAVWLLSGTLDKTNIRDRQLIWVATLTGLFYITALGRSDLSHVAVSLVPAIVLLSLIVDIYMKSNGPLEFDNEALFAEKNIKYLGILLVLSGLVFYTGGAGVVHSIYSTSTNSVESELPATGNLQVEQEKHANIKETIEAVDDHKREDTTLVSLAYRPGYYPLTDSVPPTRYGMFVPGALNETAVENVIEKMNNTHTLIVYEQNSGIRASEGVLTLRDSYPRLYQYMTNECELIHTVERHSRVYSCPDTNPDALASEPPSSASAPSLESTTNTPIVSARSAPTQ